MDARGVFALTLALLLHAALLNSVFRPRLQLPPEPPVTAMLWLKLAPPLPKPVWPPTVPIPPLKPAHKTTPAAVAAAAPMPKPSIAVPAPQVAAEAPPARLSIEQIMSKAKRELGKIDKDLRQEHAQSPRAFGASPDTAQRRLEKGFEQAHEAAPNKWYQAAKIEDITPPGDDERKIYRISSALGTYCVRYADKNRKFDHGQANLGEALIGACPHMF